MHLVTDVGVFLLFFSLAATDDLICHRIPYQSDTVETSFNQIFITGCPCASENFLIFSQFNGCNVEKYTEYYYTTSGDKYYYTLDPENLPKHVVASTKNLTIIIHGFWHNFRFNGTSWTEPMGMKIAEVTKGTTILVNYRSLAFCRYDIIAQKIQPLLSESLAAFINRLNKPLDQITLIGQSFGGQIVGNTGSKLNGEIGKIYALDPAGPEFSNSRRRGLSQKSAKYVQVLHTDWFFGDLTTMGHADYYANRYTWNLQQPGCIANLCSHTMALRLFDAALFSEYPFFGKGCKGTDSSEISRYGLLNDDRKHGSFCFDTTECFPYTNEYNETTKYQHVYF